MVSQETLDYYGIKELRGEDNDVCIGDWELFKKRTKEIYTNWNYGEYSSDLSYIQERTMVNNFLIKMDRKRKLNKLYGE